MQVYRSWCMYLLCGYLLLKLYQRHLFHTFTCRQTRLNNSKHYGMTRCTSLQFYGIFSHRHGKMAISVHARPELHNSLILQNGVQTFQSNMKSIKTTFQFRSGLSDLAVHGHCSRLHHHLPISDISNYICHQCY